MSLNAIENVMSNVDILLQVYSLLDLEDQFKLSRVSAQLKEVFETFIWRKRYTTLKVIVRPPYFVITNETDMNRLYLNYKQFQEFQRSYAADVEDLTIIMAVVIPSPYDSCGNEWDGGDLGVQHRPTLTQDQFDLRLFRHVTKLRCHHMLLELSYLNLIAECCPNLHELCLLQFDYEFSCDNLLSSLQRMENLKILYLNTYTPFPMEFKNLQALLATNNLEQLQLNHTIDLSVIMMGTQKALTLPSRLKHLRIWTGCGTADCRWLKNFSNYLGSFKYLTSLYIKLSSTLSDEGLAMIAGNCKNLEQLTLKCVIFEALQTFVVPPKLIELTLSWCVGLTCYNLQQIVTQLRLRKFVSKNTNYFGSYEFRVSPYLLSLHVDGISTHRFKPAVESHANLKELSWFQREPSHGMGAGAALAAWANLEMLDIRDFEVAFDSIRQLKTLKKVIVPRRPSHLTWLFIMELLKHPILEELNLRYPEFDDVMDEESMFQKSFALVSMYSSAEIGTNLRSLELSLEIFQNDAGFWLDLFRHNDKLSEMRLYCMIDANLENILSYVICGGKLPRLLKTIVVCGIDINCKKFRRNFNEEMTKLLGQIYETGLWTDNETYQISLQRSF